VPAALGESVGAVLAVRIGFEKLVEERAGRRVVQFLLEEGRLAKHRQLRLRRHRICLPDALKQVDGFAELEALLETAGDIVEGPRVDTFQQAAARHLPAQLDHLGALATLQPEAQEPAPLLVRRGLIARRFVGAGEVRPRLLVLRMGAHDRQKPLQRQVRRHRNQTLPARRPAVSGARNPS